MGLRRDGFGPPKVMKMDASGSTMSVWGTEEVVTALGQSSPLRSVIRIARL
jgi:hypothetical protein